MNEMLLPSGELWNRDRSGFLKKSRNGMSLLRPVVLVAEGMAKTRGLNEGWRNGVNDGGDTMEASALQGTRSR
jgi:hypothetical protein